jgi:hypothetical protein
MADNYEIGLGTPTQPRLETGASPDRLKDKAASEVRHLADRAQSQANEKFVEGKHRAASTLNSIASTLHRSGQQLRDEQQPMAGDIAERAATQIEKMARFVDNAEFRGMVRDVEGFARKNPAVFIGAAFAIGMLGARFLRSSQNDLERAVLTDREIRTTPVNETLDDQTSNAWQNGYGGSP